MRESSTKASIFWPVLLAVVMIDLATKWAAEAHLVPWHPPQEIAGSAVRLVLAYNPGAAFGIYLGDSTRALLSTAGMAVLVVLLQLYRSTPVGDPTRAFALALLSGGAIGNLVDRLRSPLGVVDFIDIGIGDYRWWTFNVADVAVSTGAVLLAWILWNDTPEGRTAA